MKIFDFLKKKKEVKKIEKEKLEKKEEVKLPKVKIKKPKKVKETLEIHPILKAPHISEKATDLSKGNQYVFEVYPKANKIEIKKAIEGLYGVDVLSVNIVKIPRKKRRLRRTSGFKKGYKKAIVKIKKGQKVEIL